MCRDFLNFTLGAENQRTVSISGRSEICKVTITGEKVSPMTLSTWRKRADSKRKLEVKKKKKKIKEQILSRAVLLSVSRSVNSLKSHVNHVLLLLKSFLLISLDGNNIQSKLHSYLKLSQKLSPYGFFSLFPD